MEDVVRSKLLAGVAGILIAPLFAAPAYAQDTAADEPTGGLDEIVVTAQRRSENLQNVPIAITAASGEALATARVENISNIQAVSPSITFRATNIASSTANVIIRGLGTSGNSRSFEGSVGVFIDGVYRTRAAAALQNFLDIDGLQVLRGPQGTLFGKNTTAGALLLNSTKPSTSEASGLFEATYGNYGSLLVRAAGNVPIGDTAAFRLAGVASTRDGFYTDSTTGEHLNGDKTRAVKGQLLIEPGTGLSIRLIGDYSYSTGNCCYATSSFQAGPTQPLIDYLTVIGGRTLPSAKPSDWQQTLNGNGKQTVEDYGATLMVDADLGAGTLKSVSAVRKFKLDQRDMDPDFSGADIFRYNESFESRFISQELTYNTKIEALNADAVFGVFFSDEKLHMGREMPWSNQAQAYWDVVFGGLGYPAGTASAPAGPWDKENMNGKARSYAGFGHLDFALGDKVNVITGLRYSVEKKEGSFAFDYFSPAWNDPFRLLGVSPGPAYAKSITNKAVSGTFGVQYRPNSDVMIYATYNRGFKAGGVNIDANGGGTRANNPAEVPGAVPLDPSYKPEKVNAFEVGAKFQYLDRRARTNIAFFYYDLSDLQIAQFVGLRFTVLNAKSATDYGMEIENLFQLNDALTLGIDGTWVPHAKYGVDPTIDPALSGQRFRFAPKLSANVTLNLDTPVSDTVNLVGRIQYQYTSTQQISTASNAVQGPLSLVNANLGFKIPDSNLLVEGWVQNLFNETYFTQAFPTPLQTGDQNGYLGAPRTYGVRMRMSF